MADSGDVDTALLNKLSSDPTLLGLMPDGVFWDQAPPGATRFVIVSLAEEADEPVQLARAFEDALYLVEARALSTVANSSANTKSAAARIDALLENGTLAVAGYSLMAMFREARWRVTEVDERDPDLRWYRRGGHYRVLVSAP